MNIIAVDDEPHALRSIARAIGAVLPSGELTTFDTASAVLGYARDNRVDVAFLDIEMGGMSGLSLAKHLKDIHGKTNIIFVTGYSEYALDAHALYPAGYLMKPITEDALSSALENLRHPVRRSDKGLRIQTFGNFEVFVDGDPLHFPRKKSKEILAYLVHKSGASCTVKELAAALEEKSADNVRTYISALMKTLEESGAGGVVKKDWGSVAVDTSKFDCDLYRFLNADAEAVNAYTGEYMAQYSWAEIMVGYLDRKI